MWDLQILGCSHIECPTASNLDDAFLYKNACINNVFNARTHNA